MLALGASAAGANTYAGYEKSANNLGTRSSIEVNGTWSTSAAQCVLYYSDAGIGPWIQTGVYRCFNGVSLDGTCTGGAAAYTEVKNSGVAAACTAGGGISSGTWHTYTVDNTASQWRGYVDGSLLGGALSVSGSITPLQGAAEYTGACGDSFTASATFGGSSPVWQIWNGSSWAAPSSWSSLVGSPSCGWSNSASPSPWTSAH
jgi:hypothetical protein